MIPVPTQGVLSVNTQQSTCARCGATKQTPPRVVCSAKQGGCLMNKNRYSYSVTITFIVLRVMMYFVYHYSSNAQIYYNRNIYICTVDYIQSYSAVYARNTT